MSSDKPNPQEPAIVAELKPKRKKKVSANKVAELLAELITPAIDFQHVLVKNNNVWEARHVLESDNPNAADIWERKVIEHFADNKIRVKVIKSGYHPQSYPLKNYVYIVFTVA